MESPTPASEVLGAFPPAPPPAPAASPTLCPSHCPRGESGVGLPALSPWALRGPSSVGELGLLGVEDCRWQERPEEHSQCPEAMSRADAEGNQPGHLDALGCLWLLYRLQICVSRKRGSCVSRKRTNTERSRPHPCPLSTPSRSQEKSDSCMLGSGLPLFLCVAWFLVTPAS